MLNFRTKLVCRVQIIPQFLDFSAFSKLQKTSHIMLEFIDYGLMLELLKIFSPLLYIFAALYYIH